VTLERVLEDEGYTTATAVCHEEVSKMLSRVTFDLIVLDDYLSSKNAVQVLMDLQDSRLKPLVVVTYHCVPSRDERAQLEALGVSALVNKGAHSDLTEIVHHLFEPVQPRHHGRFGSIT